MLPVFFFWFVHWWCHKCSYNYHKSCSERCSQLLAGRLWHLWVSQLSLALTSLPRCFAASTWITQFESLRRATQWIWVQRISRNISEKGLVARNSCRRTSWTPKIGITIRLEDLVDSPLQATWLWPRPPRWLWTPLLPPWPWQQRWQPPWLSLKASKPKPLGESWAPQDSVETWWTGRTKTD